MGWKQNIKRNLPSGLIRIFRVRRLVPVALDCFYDFRRFVRHSSVIDFDDDEEKLRAFITATYHNIEKGLSLPEPRPGFGSENLNRLFWLMELFIERFGPREYLATPLGALNRYIEFNNAKGVDVESVKRRTQRLTDRIGAGVSDVCGGTKLVTRESLFAAIQAGGPEVIASRVTCRQFGTTPVSLAEIERAVQIAQAAPVVCNRQSGRVRVFREKADIARILELQGGARGFGDRASALFCVSVDIRNFNGTGERYQGWIDGGMFAMNLVLGLHTQGLGACCLNWSKNRSTDVDMRKLLGLPDTETIIMFVAAGTLPESFVAAKSIRKNLREVLFDVQLK